MASATQQVGNGGSGSLVDEYLEEARRVEEMRRAKKKFRAVEASPFWPHEAIRGTVLVLAFTAAILFAAALMPYFLEKPANPAGQPEVILPDWYLLWSYGLLKPGVADPVTFNGNPVQIPILYQIEDALGPYGDTARGEMSAKTLGIILNIVITIPLMVLPFLSTGNPRRPQESPWLASFGVAGIVYVFNVSVYSANNVIFTKISWWGDSLLKLTPFLGTPGKASVAAKVATVGSVVGGLAFWVLPLPIVTFLARRYLLKETVKQALLVTVLQLVILVTIIAYAAGLDVAHLVANPLRFWADALNNTNMLAWIVWWSTLLSFEVAYWSLVKWKQWGQREEHYEHDLNLTYYKVR